MNNFGFFSVSTDDGKINAELAMDALLTAWQEHRPKLSHLVKTHVFVSEDASFLDYRDKLDAVDIVTITEPEMLNKMNYIAVGSIPAFKKNGDRATKFVFKHVPKLEELVQQQLNNKVGRRGKAYLVKTDLEFLKGVILVIGPNQNPLRGDYLEDSEKAKSLLENAYKEMFQLVLETVTTLPVTSDERGGGAKLKIQKRLDDFFKPSASKTTSSSSSSSSADKNANSTAEEEDTGSELIAIDFPPYNKPSPSMRPPDLIGRSLAIYFGGAVAFRDPLIARFTWFTKGEFCVIYDGFPKAQTHLLIVPKNAKINAVSELKKADLAMISHMHAMGRAIVNHLKSEGLVDGENFQLGFHALPSLTPLHLHVISTDFNSEKLTSKKHWNSFNHPNLFINIAQVEEQLKNSGNVTPLPQTFLSDCELADPQCYRCGLKPLGPIKTKLEILKGHRCKIN